MTSTCRTRFVGFKWWGPGPEDFASLSSNPLDTYIHIADLTSPIARRLVDIERVRTRNVSKALKRERSNQNFASNNPPLTVVFNPHRLGPDATQRLKSESSNLVAWIGDEPTAERSFYNTHRFYDHVFAPDPSWTQSGPVAAKPLTWPHLLPNRITRSPDATTGVQAGSDKKESRAPTIALIGTAYAERVDFASRARATGWHMRIVGSGWPAEFDAEPPQDRIELVDSLLREGVSVVNFAHTQMQRTLNPFFLDLAAAGIAQIYVTGSTSVVELPAHVRMHPNHFIDNDLLRRAHDCTKGLQRWATSTQSVDQKVQLISETLRW